VPGATRAAEAEAAQRDRAEASDRQSKLATAEAAAVLDFLRNQVLAAGRPAGWART
jgi:hypothetical protein